MQTRSHKVNCLCQKKGMLTMICDVVIHTHYMLLVQIYTNSLIFVIPYSSRQTPAAMTVPDINTL